MIGDWRYSSSDENFNKLYFILQRPFFCKRNTNKQKSVFLPPLG